MILKCLFVSLLFATAKVEYEHLQNQIFEPQIFPRGGDNSLIINTMKN